MTPVRYVPAALAVALALALPAPPSQGRPPERPRIGVLFWHDSPNDREAFAGVRDGFDLTGRDPVYEIVEARGDDDKARRALRDFEKRGMDLVYAMGTGAALRAGEELESTPVVFTAVTDPVGSGVVKDERGSRTNLCGTASGIAAVDVLAEFRSALPELKRLGVLHDPANPVSRAEVAAMKVAGAALRPPVDLDILTVSAGELAVTGAVEKHAATLLGRCDALWVPIDIAVYAHEADIARAAAKTGCPVVATATAASRNAAAICIAAEFRSVGRKSVVLATKCLDGADPGTLPVVRPRSYRVILNLEAARRVGFEMPLSLLVSADEFVGVAGGR